MSCLELSWPSPAELLLASTRRQAQHLPSLAPAWVHLLWLIPGFTSGHQLLDQPQGIHYLAPPGIMWPVPLVRKYVHAGGCQSRPWASLSNLSVNMKIFASLLLRHDLWPRPAHASTHCKVWRCHTESCVWGMAWQVLCLQPIPIGLCLHRLC